MIPVTNAGKNLLRWMGPAGWTDVLAETSIAAIEAEAASIEHERAVDACAKLMIAYRRDLAELVRGLPWTNTATPYGDDITLDDVLSLIAGVDLGGKEPG